MPDNKKPDQAAPYLHQGDGGAGQVSADVFSLPLPLFYVNGVAATCNLTDVTVVGMINDRPQVMLSMTHTIALTFAHNIIEVLHRLESETGMKTEDFSMLMQKIAEHKKSTGQ